MGKQADNIKKLLEAFPQLTEGEAKQYLEVHGSVEDATSAILTEENSKWSKVKAPAPKVEKKDKTSKHKTPAAVAAAAPRDASPRGERPVREPRAPRNDIAEPVKKVAPKVAGTTLVEIGGGGAKVEKGLSFLDRIKMKKEAPVEVVAPTAAPVAAPVDATTATPSAKKGGDKKKAPVEEEEVAHDPSQDPPAPTQSQAAAAAAASPEVVAATTEEPVVKKERVKKPKAPKPAKVETLYYVPQVESSETVSFPNHVLAHHIGESIKFTSIAGEAPAPPAPVQQQQHVSQHHQMTGIHHHHQQQRYGGYNTAPPNAGYGNRVNNGAPRQHVSQWQQNPPPQQGQAQTWQQPTRAPRSDYPQRGPPTGQYRNDFRGGHDGQQVDPAYNMRANNTWGN